MQEQGFAIMGRKERKAYLQAARWEGVGDAAASFRSSTAVVGDRIDISTSSSPPATWLTSSYCEIIITSYIIIDMCQLTFQVPGSRSEY